MAEIQIETDASFIDSSRPAGIAAVYVNEAGEPIMCYTKGVMCVDNLQAELHSILYGLEAIPQNRTNVIVFNDNRDAIEILNSSKTRSNKSYGIILKKIRTVIERKELRVKFIWRSRKNNKTADSVSWRMAFFPEAEKKITCSKLSK